MCHCHLVSLFKSFYFYLCLSLCECVCLCTWVCETDCFAVWYVLDRETHTHAHTVTLTAQLTQLHRFIEEEMQSLLPRVTSSGECQLVNPWHWHTHTQSSLWTQLPDVIQASLLQSKCVCVCVCGKQTHLGLAKCEVDHAIQPPFTRKHTHTYTHFPTPCRDIFPHLTTVNFSWLFYSLHVNVVLEQDAEPQIAPDVKIVSGFGQKERNKMVV